MSEMNGAAIARLRKAGLRPTRQRRELAELLFGDISDIGEAAEGLRKLTYGGIGEAVTAEGLHGLALRGGIKVSLATVYGTLHSFCDAGLVREISIDSKRYFDTNTENHQYFFFEEERRLVGVTEPQTGFKDMPPPPEGRRVSRVDVVVRLCKDEARNRR